MEKLMLKSLVTPAAAAAHPMDITRRSFSFAALAGTLFSGMPALAKAPFAGAQMPGVYRLKVGAFEVTVLSDGWLPIETKLFAGDPAGADRFVIIPLTHVRKCSNIATIERSRCQKMRNFKNLVG
jgi:hypothetical protein